MVQVVLQNLLSLTSYADDVILSASDSLYYFIDSSLDVLECLAVELHAVLPYFAALPLQVLIYKHSGSTTTSSNYDVIIIG